jgi:hypothetical protein
LYTFPSLARTKIGPIPLKYVELITATATTVKLDMDEPANRFVTVVPERGVSSGRHRIADVLGKFHPYSCPFEPIANP